MVWYKKLILYLVEASSIPLLLLSIVMVLSGYGMLKPWIIEDLTLGILSYSISARIHTDKIIRSSFSILLIIHSITGSYILIDRRIRFKKINYILKALSLIVLLYVLAIIIMCEIT